MLWAGSDMYRQTVRGFSLTEILIVVAILGITAVVVVPSFNSGDEKQLDVAANEVAQALRFARSEAIRTGSIHGIQISQNTQRVVVYKADMTSDPVSMASILIHPIDKKPFDFDFDNQSITLGSKIINTLDPFSYTGLGRSKNLLFDASGTPIWVVVSSNTTYLMTEGKVELEYAGQQQIVSVAPVTGRISIE